MTKDRAAWEEDEYKLALLTLWKSLGRTSPEVAKLMGITYKTLKEWMLLSPAIKEAIAAGKDTIADKIAGKMASRAMGYEYTEVKNTIEHGQVVKTEHTKKHQPPDVGAQIFMLTNLRPDLWKNTQKVDATVKTDIPDAYKKLSVEELRKLADPES